MTAEVPAAHVARTARERVELFVRPQGDRLFAQVRGAIEQASQEYAGRTLLELVQNGHDAIPRTGGRMTIRLKEAEGEFGTLYVANSGRPFGATNFDAICDLAQSDKHVDEGIGNKGVGFKSVLGLTDSPEIYSVNPAEPSAGLTGGYSFRFANANDITRLAGGDSELAQRISAGVSSLSLPVPVSADQAPAPALRLLSIDEGGDTDRFVTVIRIPLRDDQARQSLGRQLAALVADDPPALLFLERVRSLTIDGGSPETTTQLRRDASPHPSSPRSARCDIDIVDLGRERTFIVSRREVPVETMRAAIRESVQNGTLGRRWLEWEGEAAVGLAISAGGPPIVGRYYTFLPMGEAAGAPLPAHVNGPFFTRLARLDLDTDVPLNSLLLDELATLALLSARALRSEGSPVARLAIGDLLSWDADQSSRLEAAFERGSPSLSEDPIVPIEGASRWGRLSEVIRWPQDFVGLTSDRLANWAGAQIVDRALDVDRVERLAGVATVLTGNTLEPEPGAVGAWVMSVVDRLRQGGGPEEDFATIYDDLARLGLPPDALEGKSILLDDDGALQQASSARGPKAGRLLFFSPAGDVDEDGEAGEDDLGDLTVPPRLGRHLGFMHHAIEWAPITDGRRAQRPGRRYLADSRFVQRYEARRVLRVVQRAMTGRGGEPTFEEALRFTFELWRRNRSPATLDLAAVGLKVPTLSGGWVPTDETSFSSDWTPTGQVLEQLIDQAAPFSDEIAELGRQLLAAPSQWPFAVSDELAEWTEFLAQAGVWDGLRPITTEPAHPTYYGPSFPTAAAAELDLDQWSTAAWKAEASSIGWWQTDYQLDAPWHTLPGQADFEAFPKRAKLTYAKLIAEGLGAWPDQVLRAELSKPKGNQHRPQLSSPLASFLRSAPWVPTADPGQRSQERFGLARDAWHVRGASPPRYAAVVAGDIRRRLERNQVASERVGALGLNVWDDATSQPALLRHLPRLLHEGAVDPTDRAQLRNDYRDAWSLLVDSDGDDPFTGDDPGLLLVDDGMKLATVAVADPDGPAVLIPDAPDKTRRALLASLRRPVLPVNPGDGSVIAERYLFPHLGGRARRTSALQIDILVDGKAAQACAAAPLLGAGEEWLADTVAVILLLRSDAFAATTPQAAQEAADTLRSTQVIVGQHLVVALDGEPVELPSSLRRALAVEGADRPLIATTEPPLPPTWSSLVELSAAICEVAGRPRAANDLDLAFRRLSELGTGPSGHPAQPSAADLARALDETEERVAEAQASLRGPAQRAVWRLVPLVAYHAGTEAARALEAAATDVDGVLEQARLAIAPFVADPEADVAEAETAPAVEHLLGPPLGLKLRRLNHALDELGPPYLAINNAEGHRVALDRFIGRNRGEIVDLLREAHRPASPTTPASDTYLKSRTLGDLAPDLTWVVDHYLPPEDLLRQRVDGWLRDHGASPLGTKPTGGLEPLEELQHANRATVKQTARSVIPLARAWAQAKSVEPGIWASTDAADQAADLAFGAGVTDFVRLTRQQVLEWLDACGHLPAGMPATEDWDELGVPPPPRGKDPEPGPPAPPLTINGTELSASASSYDQIAEAVKGGLQEGFFAEHADLDTWTETPGSPTPPGGEHGGGGGGGRHRDTSDATGWAIGYAGEVAALEWLNRKYDPAKVQWRSSYRDDHFGGTQGNNSLGYDFEVLDDDGPILYEVKATSGTSTEFGLPPVEFRCAQRHASDNRYRILYITEVLDGDRTRAVELPNPVGKHADRYRLLDSTVTFGFRLSPSAAEDS